MKSCNVSQTLRTGADEAGSIHSLATASVIRRKPIHYSDSGLYVLVEVMLKSFTSSTSFETVAFKGN